MSHGIKKETYVKADEETTKSLTFDLLDNLYNKMAESQEIQIQQVEKCGVRFKTIENGKKKDTAISAASGFGGGFFAVGAIWLKAWVKKNFGI